MKKADYLKKLIKDVFETIKISSAKQNSKNLSRYNGYFFKCALNDRSFLKFMELFTVSLTIENSKYELGKGQTKSIDKKRVIENFSNHIKDCYGISIYCKFDSNNMSRYIVKIIYIVEEMIAPELFNGNRDDEINLNNIKKKISEYINPKSSESDIKENICFLLKSNEKEELLKNADSWNKYISEATNDAMGLMTLKEYIRRLEREASKFYRNIDNDILQKYLSTAENVKKTFFSDEINDDNFKYEILRTLDTYIFKLIHMINSQL